MEKNKKTKEVLDNCSLCHKDIYYGDPYVYVDGKRCHVKCAKKTGG